jgi:hypothetical protein
MKNSITAYWFRTLSTMLLADSCCFSALSASASLPLFFAEVSTAMVLGRRGDGSIGTPATIFPSGRQRCKVLRANHNKQEARDQTSTGC